jgi:siroheme synthase
MVWAKVALAVHRYEGHPADVTLVDPGIVVDCGQSTIRTAHNGQDVVRLHSDGPYVEERTWEGAGPLAG